MPLSLHYPMNLNLQSYDNVDKDLILSPLSQIIHFFSWFAIWNGERWLNAKAENYVYYKGAMAPTKILQNILL